jgi:hypothetical protein
MTVAVPCEELTDEILNSFHPQFCSLTPGWSCNPAQQRCKWTLMCCIRRSCRKLLFHGSECSERAPLA